MGGGKVGLVWFGFPQIPWVNESTQWCSELAKSPGFTAVMQYMNMSYNQLCCPWWKDL